MPNSGLVMSWLYKITFARLFACLRSRISKVQTSSATGLAHEARWHGQWLTWTNSGGHRTVGQCQGLRQHLWLCPMIWWPQEEA